jgi:hypothetical protein
MEKLQLINAEMAKLAKILKFTWSISSYILFFRFKFHINCRFSGCRESPIFVPYSLISTTLYVFGAFAKLKIRLSINVML